MGNPHFDRLLKNAGHSSLLPMQENFLAASTREDELILYSETGSGKTLAFLLAGLRLLFEKKDSRMCIIAPSRELCLQIEQVFRSLKSERTISCCYGGHSVRIESNQLAANPDCIVATPGRLCDHLRRGHLPNPTDFKVLIVDEFDKCLEAGFAEEMSQIFHEFPTLKKKVLVSATPLDEIPPFCGMKRPFILDERKEEETPDITEMVLVHTQPAKKALFDLLCTFRNEKTIVFCNYREVAEDVAWTLQDEGLTCTCYHGGMEQEERERALIKFRNDSSNILVCTDLGARGLDIPEIMHVVHYQLPSSEDAYIHRKGRSARMGAKGFSYLLKEPDGQLPFYVQPPDQEKRLPSKPMIPAVEKVTLYISAGKRDKVNKVDIVGFLIQQGGLEKSEIGLITVLDHSAYVAIPKKKSSSVLDRIRQVKLKGKRLKIALSR